MSPYRPIALEAAAYKFGGGVETKVHGLALPPPKLQVCENAHIDQSGSIQRRFGRTPLPEFNVLEQPITGAWVALGKHQERLLGFKHDRVYDYGEPDSRWADRGRCVSWKQETHGVDSGDLAALGPGTKDMATIGPYRLYAFETIRSLLPASNQTEVRTYFTLVDEKGTRYTSAQLLAVDGPATGIKQGSAVKVIAWENKFYIVYCDQRDPGKLKCFMVDVAYPSTIASTLQGTPTDLANDYPNPSSNGTLDLIADPVYGPVVAWRTSAANQIRIGRITGLGGLGHNATLTTVAPPKSVSLASSGTGNFAVAYHKAVVGADIYVQLWNYNGTAWSLTSASGALDTIANPNPGQTSVVFDSATVARVFYQDIASFYPCLRQNTYSTTGAVGTRLTMQRSILMARPWKERRTGMLYMVVMLDQYLGPVATPTMYICTYTGLVTGVMSAGVAAYNTNRLHDASAMKHTPPHVTGQTQHELDWGADPDTYRFMSDQYSRLVSTGFSAASGSQSNMVEMVIRTVDDMTHCMIENNECTYIAGGMLQQYDGVGCTENNFVQPLNTLSNIPNTALNHWTAAGAVDGGDNLALGEYSYQLVPEWINAQGVREQGTNLGSITYTLASPNDSINLTFDSQPFTLKQTANGRTNMVIAVYRSLVGTTSKSQHFRVGQVENDPTIPRLTFHDSRPDSAIKVQEMCYLDAGILDNVPPGAGGHIIAAGNGRVFVAGFPDDPNMVRYSKQRGHDEGLAFNESLAILSPKVFGDITALAVMNESLIIFTENAIFRTNGDGLNNTGTAGGFLDPVQAQAESGSINMRGTIITPGGVLFKSRKGMMMLRTSFVMDYIGSPLEKLADPGPCKGTVLVPQMQQARVSYLDTTHVFDYYHREWYVFTHGADGPTTVVNDRHMAIKGVVFFDDPQAWQDGDDQYIVRLELAWFHGDSLFNDLMVRKVGVIGYAPVNAFLTMQVANDQGGNYQTMEPRFGSSVAGQIMLQYRTGRRLLSQIRITITDSRTTEFGEEVVIGDRGWRLNELTFEIGKRNPMIARGVGVQ